jgi:hypothetical protein
MSRKLTTDEFIVKAKTIHGEKYDYSKVEYIGSRDKVIIICKIHGEFIQTSDTHIRGSGCPHCISHVKGSTDSFIKKAILIHREKYDYSKTNYTITKDKVIIICKTHGEFTQTPNNHLMGSGCPQCVPNFKKTAEQFILKANKIHDKKYDYSKVEYVVSHSKVTIICKTHGEFTQTPSSHLWGRGCPQCGDLKKLVVFSNNDKKATLYYIKIKDTSFFKIGITTHSISKRFSQDLEKIVVVKAWEFGASDVYNIEQEILKAASNLRYSGTPLLKSGGNSEIVIKDILPLIEHTLSGYVT